MENVRIESFPLSRKVTIEKPQDLKPVAKVYDQDGKDKPERDGSKDLNRAVDKLNQTAELFNRHLKFKIHEGTKRTVVQIIDNESDKVIQEFPLEKVLDMLANLEKTVGMLIDRLV